MSPSPQTPDFNTIARTLPSDLPQETYDNLRRQYFGSVVVPKMKESDNIDQVWADFKKQTDRPALLSSSERGELQAHITANTALQSFLAPMKDLSTTVKGLHDSAVAKGQELEKTAQREGMNTNIAHIVGGIAGAMPDFAALQMALGPMAEGVIGAAGMTGRAAELIGSAAEGGATFATYNALSAEQGQRIVEGVKGFGQGAALGLVFSPGGLLLKRGHAAAAENVDEVVKQTAVGKGKGFPAEVDQTLSQKEVNNAQVSKLEGRSRYWGFNTGQRGARLFVTDVAGQDHQLDIKPAREAATYQQAMQLVQQGGSFSHFEVHPDDQGVLNEFLRIQDKVEQAKYKPTVVRTQAGQEQAVVQEAAQRGIPAEVAGTGNVLLHTVEQQVPDEVKTQAAQADEGRVAPVTPQPTEAIGQKAAPSTAPLERGMPPTREQAEAAFLQKGVQRKDLPFLTRSVEKLWDEEIPEEAKVSERAIVNRVAPELVPLSQEAAEAQAGEIERGEAIRRSAPTRPPIANLPLDDKIPSGETLQEFERIPAANRARVPAELLQKYFPGSQAVTIGNPGMDVAVKAGKMGVRLPVSAGKVEPLVVYSELNPTVDYHEALHYNIMMARAHNNFQEFVPPEHVGTAVDIGKGLVTNHPVYAGFSHSGALNEAFVHAATAVRLGDQEYLEQLARWDTDVQRVKDFVGATAADLQEHASFLDGSVQARNLQKTAADLIRRTSPNVTEQMKDGLAITGSGSAAWWDANRGWVIRDAVGEKAFSDVKSLWDHVLNNDKNFLAPEYGYMPLKAGVRGGLTPPDKPPSGALPPNPDTPIDAKSLGWEGLSAWWRPALPWTASVHEAVNDILRSSGKAMDLFGKVKAVDEAERQAGQWVEKMYGKSSDILQHFDQKKMYDVFQYLTHGESERTSALLQKYGMTQEDGLYAHQYWEHLKEFESETFIPIRKYFQDIHPRLRGNGWDNQSVFGPGINPNNPSFWEGAIRYDQTWNPQDAHLGRFDRFIINAGKNKMFTGQALDDLNKLINLKGVNDKPVLPDNIRYPLQNYHDRLKNLPDQSMKMLNGAMGDFFDHVNKRIDTLNEHLPAGVKLNKITSPPRTIMNRAILLSYAGGLAGRPAVMLRDMLQMFTSVMPVLGPARFARALAGGLNSDAFASAREAGALMARENIGEMYGDITGEMPTGGKDLWGKLARWSNMALSPGRWSHNLTRTVLFNGEYRDALAAIKDFRAGSITTDQLLKEHTSLWFMDKPDQSQLLKLVTDPKVSPEDAAKQFGLRAVDTMLFPYRRGTQPLALRFGAGRILGQYGVYPANYVDFMARVGRKWFQFPQNGTRTAALWAASNYALSATMEGVGVDTSKWFWQSPAGFAGGPNMQFVQDLMLAPENSQQGREARRRVLEFPLDFVPASNELEGVLKGFDQHGVDEWPPSEDTIMRTLGFTPLAQKATERSWQDWVRYQAGLPKSKP